MKRILLIAMAVCLAGCASMSYKTKDGTEVKYTRFLTTSDTLKGEIPGGAKVEAGGQKIDTTTLQAILQLLGTVK